VVGPVERRDEAGLSRVLIWVALAVAALWVLLVGGTHPGIVRPPIRVLTHVVGVVVLVAWLAGCVVRPSWRPRSSLLLPIAIAFAAFALAALFSLRPRLSQDAVYQAGALTLTFVLLLRLAPDPFFGPRLRAITAMFPLLVIVAYLVHTVVAWGLFWQATDGFTVPPVRPSIDAFTDASPFAATLLGLFGVRLPNLVAAIVVLGAPYTIGVAARRSRAAAALIGTLAVFVLLVTASRGGALGGAAAISTFAVLTLVPRWRSDAPLRLPDRRIRAALLGIAAVGLILAAPVAGRLAGGLDSARESVYSATVQLIGQHPLLGAGPGTLALLKSATTSEGQTNAVVFHAHSTYLQTLSDVGVIGVLAVAVVIALIARRLWRSATAADTPDRGDARLIVAGLVGAAVHAVPDHFVNLPTFTLLLLSLVSLGLAADGDPADARPPVGGRVGRAIALAALAAAVIPLPSLLTHSQAELIAEDGRLNADQGQWSVAAAAFRTASVLDPQLTLYRLELGTALARSGDPAALEILRSVVDEDPLPHLLLSVAYLEAAAGNSHRAVDDVRLATARTSGESIVDLNAAAIYLDAGDRGLAIEHYAEAIALNVELAGSAYFTRPPVSNIRAQVLDRAAMFLEAREETAQLGLMRVLAGDEEAGFATLVGAAPSVERDLALARARIATGDRYGAIADLEALARAHPVDRRPLELLIRYLDSDPPDARLARYRRWLGVLLGGETAASADIGSTIPAPDDQRWRGIPSAYPAAVYLRDGPRDLLIPQVLVVGEP